MNEYVSEGNLSFLMMHHDSTTYLPTVRPADRSTQYKYGTGAERAFSFREFLGPGRSKTEVKGHSTGSWVWLARSRELQYLDKRLTLK